MAYEAYLRGPFPAAITAGLAVLSLVLSLIALLSTSEQFPLEQFSIVTIDTSFLLQNVIGLDGDFLKRDQIPALEVRQVPAATDVPAAPAADAVATPAVSSGSIDAQATFFPFRPTTTSRDGLFPQPTPSTGNENGIGSGSGNDGDGQDGTAATPSSGSTAGGTSGQFAARTFLGDMQLLSNTLMSAARGNTRVSSEAFGTQINDFFGDIMGNFGIRGFYGLYMSSICEGELFRTGDGNNGGGFNNNNGGRGNNFNVPLIFNTFECVRYTSLSSGSFSGSNQFGVGGSILDFRNFNFLQRFSDGNNGFNSIFVAIFILQIFGIVCLFLLLPIAGIYICIRIRIISILISALIFLAFALFLVAAVLVTATNVFITTLINSLFFGIGLEATGGGPLLALLWVNVGIVLFAMLIWFAKWHRSSFTRRVSRKDKAVMSGGGGEGGGSRGIGGGQPFRASFLRGLRSKKNTGAQNTPIYENFKSKERERDVEYA